MMPEEKKAAWRERAKAYHERHRDDPEYRAKRSQAAMKSLRKRLAADPEFRAAHLARRRERNRRYYQRKKMEAAP
jgi:hypothetical protein